LILVRSRLAAGNASPPAARRRPRRAPETDFRHAVLVSTGPYRMNAAFMRLERHERGIHVV
jgi:hypothetical protein